MVVIMFPRLASPVAKEGPADRVRRVLDDLGLREDHFLLGANGALALRGIREAARLDLFVSRTEYARLKADPRWIEFIDPRSPRLGTISDGWEISAFADWRWASYVVDVQWHLRHPEYVAGIPCCALNYILQWKRRAPGGAADVALIERYLVDGGS